jgi:hypothetical protein
MIKSIRETNVRSLFLGKNITDDDLRARYSKHLETNPIRPKISIRGDGTATIVTSYFEYAEPKVCHLCPQDICTEGGLMKLQIGICSNSRAPETS